MSPSRRSFLQHTAECVAASTLISVPALAQQAKRTQPAKKQQKEEDVDPPEDLMREHGLLNRVLLIYEEVIRRVTAREQFDPKPLADSAAIIRTFIESYHEKLEEDYLFPRFRKAGKLVELVDTLQTQHAAGRQLTAQIEQLAKSQSLSNDSDRTRLTTSIQEFIRMYRPHEAREDTILFPALRSIVSEHEFDALGEEFETKEHQLFGKEGFEGEVEKVAEIEKQLGIYDLGKFTPKIAS
jgi:hemerythrin-like domain-containing protein